MKIPMTSLVKQFLIICPNGLDSSLLNSAIESISYPVKQSIGVNGTIFSALPRLDSQDNLTFPVICGDDQDFNPQESQFLGNGVNIDCPKEGGMEISSSLMGLPPVYVYRDSRCTVISNNIESIAKLPCCSLHFDMQSVIELAEIGHPINHRSLFKEIELVPAGSVVSIIDTTVEIKKDIWRPTEVDQFQSIEQYLEEMVATMQAAIGRMDVSRSFLSLTAGLDTRAIIAALSIEDKLIPSLTISGRFPTIDAIRASQLSNAYGISHKMVVVDDAMNTKLPEYSITASRISGGLHSLEQATEVHMYDIAGSDFKARLCGILGNQVGRSGTEGTGTRGAPTTCLDLNSGSYLNSCKQEHWFFKANPEKELLSPGFIIPRENLFSILGNYSVGHEFATQQTPYADRTLINNKYREPPLSRDNPTSIKGIKLRDLKHRFIGQSSKKSFQCRIVQQAGGFSAECPINWGWKVNGSFSPGGLLYGVRALSDIVIGSKLDRIPGATKLLSAAGIKGFSSFHTRQGLYSHNMQNFIKDLLHKQTVRDSGLFKKQRLEQLCANSLTDDSSYAEIVLALDLALAVENFNATL